ncbi:hypothetical protein WJX73_004097 [Symbiochloris irregularis]|uniref:Uncharacterized protein n=1 Tax=Symbiochloris irregularis TaxID=706552 RepID=A0AAW1PV82_9CHLO
MVKLGWKSTADDVIRASRISLAGKTAIVTGGNTGIGKETVQSLAKAGARVVFTARSVSKADAAADYIRAAVKDANIVTKQMDLTDLSSIKAFTADFLKTEERLDLLICNAGVMACPQEYTSAGFELQIGTNHFGHFALVQQLIDRLQAQTFPSRIVVVASLAYAFGAIDIDDLHFRKRAYTKWSAYGQSKLANVLFAKQLATRTPDHVSVFSLHPGLVKTELGRHLMDSASFTARITQFFLSPVLKRPDQGAATSVFAATHPGLEQHCGAYFEDCAVAKLSTKAAKDMDMAARLWDATEQQLAACQAA